MKKLFFLALSTMFIATLAAASPASAQYSPMFMTCNPTTVVEGESLTVTAGYFQPGSDVVVRIESTPVVLGTLVTRADGTVSSAFTLPSSVGVGSHTIFAVGPRMDTGAITEVSCGLTVIGANVSPSSIVTGPSTGSLPVTGSDSGLYVAVGVGLLVTGGLLVLGNRKRNAQRA